MNAVKVMFSIAIEFLALVSVAVLVIGTVIAISRRINDFTDILLLQRVLTICGVSLEGYYYGIIFTFLMFITLPWLVSDNSSSPNSVIWPFYISVLSLLFLVVIIIILMIPVFLRNNLRYFFRVLNKKNLGIYIFISAIYQLLLAVVFSINLFHLTTWQNISGIVTSGSLLLVYFIFLIRLFLGQQDEKRIKAIIVEGVDKRIFENTDLYLFGVFGKWVILRTKTGKVTTSFFAVSTNKVTLLNTYL